MGSRRKIRLRFGHMTRLQGLMATLVSIAVTLSILFGVIFAWISRQDTLRVVEAEIVSDAYQARVYLDTQIQNIQNVFNDLIGDPFLQKYFSDLFETDPYDLMEFNRRVQSMAGRNEFIDTVDVYVRRTGVLFTSDKGPTSHLDDRTRTYLEHCMDEMNGPEVTQEYRDNLFYFLHRAKNHVTFLFPIYGQYVGGHKMSGIAAVSVRISLLINLIGAGEDRCRMLLDSQGQVFLCNQEHMTPGSSFEGVVPDGAGAMRQEVDGTVQLTAFEPIDYANWMLVVMQPTDQIGWSGWRVYAVWLVVLNVALILAAEILIVRYLSRRIRPLMELMESVEQGNFRPRSTRNERDEFSYLFDAFDSMRDQIQRQYSEIYHLSLLQKEANLKLMHAQIDPHFIYNIFNNMNWLIELKQYEPLADMVDAVSVYFKKSLNNGRTFISVRDEAELLERYLTIERLRFGGRFTAKIDMQPEILEMRILNHLLQPLVENALRHGIEPLTRTGTVTIRGFLQGENLIFQVCDDGVGMNEQTLRDLNHTFQRAQTEAEAFFALNNIHQRIRILYGEVYGLTVHSTQGKGTQVQVTLPRETPRGGIRDAMEGG